MLACHSRGGQKGVIWSEWVCRVLRTGLVGLWLKQTENQPDNTGGKGQQNATDRTLVSFGCRTALQNSIAELRRQNNNIALLYFITIR